jgi:hypothetical protein
MKKTVSIFLAACLSLLLFSCNLDASEGIFREISDETEPTDIVYTDLYGFDDSDKLYIRTIDGLYWIENGGDSKLFLNVSSDFRLEDVAYNDDFTELYVLYDDSVYVFDDDQYADLDPDDDENVIDTDSAVAIEVVDGTTGGSDTVEDNGYTIERLYQNRTMLLVDDTNQFYRLGTFEYDESTGEGTFDDSSYATINEVLDDLTSYGFATMFQQTTMERDEDAAVILSFVNDDEEYVHYYYEPGSDYYELTGLVDDDDDDEYYSIANFTVYDDILYVLTQEGDLYYADIDGAASGDSFELESLETSSDDYDKNAFLYPVVDTDNEELYLITQMDDDYIQIYPVDISDDDPSSDSEVEIDEGYAENLETSLVVGAVDLTASGTTDTKTLFVATYDGNLYDVTINAEYASDDDSDNGSATVSSDYEF